ncbi:MAG: archaemetzincin [Syntrophotaleaceae bacterium]
MFLSDSPPGETIREIRLLWTEGVDKDVIFFLRDRLPGIFSLRVTGEKRFEPDFDACRERSCQFDSHLFLQQLPLRKPAQSLLLAVTVADLFAPGMNYVFGSADPRTGCAVISLARLVPAASRMLLLRRALVEAVHEIGHLLGLGHCRKTGCVMHFSSCLSDTDRKQPAFCPHCRKVLQRE